MRDRGGRMLGPVRLRQVLGGELRLELRSACSRVIREHGDSEPVLSRAISSGASSLQDRGRRQPAPTLSAGKPASALCLRLLRCQVPRDQCLQPDQARTNDGFASGGCTPRGVYRSRCRVNLSS